MSFLKYFQRCFGLSLQTGFLEPFKKTVQFSFAYSLFGLVQFVAWDEIGLYARRTSPHTKYEHDLIKTNPSP